MTLCFIRHGQSAANAGLPTSDPALIPLTPLGRTQAQQLAHWLTMPPTAEEAASGPARITAIVTSHYTRAIDTAAPLCQRHGITPRTDARLHEFVTLSPAAVAHTTAQERKPLVDAYWHTADPHARHGAGAETFTEFATRVADFRHDLSHHRSGTIIVGHGMWIAMLLWQIQGFDWHDPLAMRAFRRYQLALPMPNCAAWWLSSLPPAAPGSHYLGDSTVPTPWAMRFDQALYRRLHAADNAGDHSSDDAGACGT